jgi:hypothetical protein
MDVPFAAIPLNVSLAIQLLHLNALPAQLASSLTTVLAPLAKVTVRHALQLPGAQPFHHNILLDMFWQL